MSNFSITHMHYVIIIVETDIGITGYGEATPSWDVNGETPASTLLAKQIAKGITLKNGYMYVEKQGMGVSSPSKIGENYQSTPAIT